MPQTVSAKLPFYTCLTSVITFLVEKERLSWLRVSEVAVKTPTELEQNVVVLKVRYYRCLINLWIFRVKPSPFSLKETVISCPKRGLDVRFFNKHLLMIAWQLVSHMFNMLVKKILFKILPPTPHASPDYFVHSTYTVEIRNFDPGARQPGIEPQLRRARLCLLQFVHL